MGTRRSRGVTTSASSRVAELDALVRRGGNAKRAVAEKAYLKSPLAHYGTAVPAIRRAVKDTLVEPASRSQRGRTALVRRLWSSGVHEHRMAAVMLLEQLAAVLQAGELRLVERMIRESFTWAYVDALAAHVAGTLVVRYPTLLADLDRWAADERFWVRRAALLALLGPIRGGGGDWPRFVRYADSMLDEDEFFIRKAIGWVLREASKQTPDRVRAYVESRRDRLSGLTLREATKYLSPADRGALPSTRWPRSQTACGAAVGADSGCAGARIPDGASGGLRAVDEERGSSGSMERGAVGAIPRVRPRVRAGGFAASPTHVGNRQPARNSQRQSQRDGRASSRRATSSAVKVLTLAFNRRMSIDRI